MFIPKKVKYRKQQRGRLPSGKTSRGFEINFGSFGLKAMSSGLVNSLQLEAARRAITRFVQRGGKIWIRVFPAHAVTSKGAEARMGKGKGDVDHYVSKVEKGRIIFEIDGVEPDVAKEALRLASFKLPLKMKIVSKQ